MSTGTPRECLLKRRLSLRNGSVAFRQVDPTHKKEHKILKLFKESFLKNILCQKQ